MSIYATFKLLKCLYGDKVKRYDDIVDAFSILIDGKQIDFCSYSNMIGRISKYHYFDYFSAFRMVEIIYKGKKESSRLSISDVFLLTPKHIYEDTKHQINFIDDFFSPIIKYDPKYGYLSKIAIIDDINKMLRVKIKKNLSDKYILLKELICGDIAKIITNKIFLLMAEN